MYFIYVIICPLYHMLFIYVIFIDYYMAFFMSHVISTRDAHISPRAFLNICES